MQYIVNNIFTTQLYRFLQLLSLCFVFIFSTSAQAWFNNNWPYRAHVVLTNSSGNNVTDHVFEINLSAADLHPDYSWSAAGADVRVYDSNDSTALDFFIEYWDQSAKTTSILLKTSLNNGQSKTIYIYYGYTSGPSLSNIVAVLTEAGLRFHTRNGPYKPSSSPTLAQVEAAFDAIADSSGYNCAQVSNFTNLSNSGTPIFGSGNDIFFRVEHWFYVGATDVGEWRFEYSGDYGNGGALFIDSIERHDRWGDDLWWGNSWANTSQILRTNGNDTDPNAAGHPSLAIGWHVMKFFGSEECCDGGTSVRFQKPSLPKGINDGDTSAGKNGWYEWSLANHADIRSPSCSTDNFPTVITPPNLQTSTKAGIDLNGGNLNAGDTIRYTITFNETNLQSAERVSFSDNMMGKNISSINVVSLPLGASSIVAGKLLTVNDILVSPSATIVFDAIIKASTAPGSIIINSLDYDSPGGNAALAQDIINANTLTTYEPPAATVTKILYLYNNADELNRFIDTTTDRIEIDETNSNTWTLTPALQDVLNLDNASNISVTLLLSERGPGSTRDFNIIIGDGTQTIGSLSNISEDLSGENFFTYSIPITNSTIPSGRPIILTIENITTGSGNRRIRVRDIQANNSPNSSRVELPVTTYIDVASVQYFNAAYPAGSVMGELAPGDNVWVRATVTDPFGHADITGITFNVSDPIPAIVNTYTDASPEVTQPAALTINNTKTYELAYQIPAFPLFGDWTFTAIAKEGNEATVTDTRSSTITVNAQPLINILKSANATSVNPSDIITYSITLTNSGQGDAFNVLMTDTLSSYTSLRTQFNGVEATPFLCSSGCGTSGLSFTTGSEVYNDINNMWNHILTSGGGGAPVGYDAGVTEWRIPLTGQLNNVNVISPSTNVYTIQYQTIVE